MNHHKLDNALAGGVKWETVVDIRPFAAAIQMTVARLYADHGVIPPRLSIGVDVDDVLYGWYARAHEICEAAGITNGVVPTTWAPHEEYGCEHTAWIDALDAATQSGYLYDADPLEGVVEALWRLRAAGHYVHLVTARGAWAHSDLVKEHTRAWVEKHGIPHDSLTFTKHKPDVPCDYFIDDHVRNIEELRAAGVKTFVMDRPWNQALDPGNADMVGARRVSSLGEFADIILKEQA